MTAEIAAVIADGSFFSGRSSEADGRDGRAGAFSPVLEDQTVPTPESVAAVAKKLCNER